MAEVDPITAEVIRHGLFAIANEMSDTMVRTATTSTFSESHDFSTSIVDGNGRLVSLSDGIPNHMGAVKFSVLEILKDFKDDLHPGDIVILNDPYHGGSHIPDWTMMTPIFYDGELVLFPVIRAHQGDTGGAVPGGYNPGATDIWQEGLRLPPIKVYERGKPRTDIIKLLQINTREPKFIGDFHAMLGSVRVGERRILEMLRRYSLGTMKDAIEFILDYTEKRFRAEIEKWPDGVYTGEAYLEHDCQGVRDITVRVAVTVSGDCLKLDFTGSDPQTPGFINSPVPNSYSFIFLALSSMIDDSIPRNDGLLRPLDVILPQGTVVNPLPPAPVTACTLHIGLEIGEAIAIALEKAIPERAYLQNVKMGMPIVTYGMNPYDGEFYLDQNTNMSAGWCNAAYGTDGWGSLPPFFGSMTMATAELHDMYFPVETIEREYMTDSGGPGKWRGGLATAVRQKALAPMFAHTYLIGTKYTMRGLNGGMDGPPNKTVLREGTPKELVVETTGYGVPLSPGHVLFVEFGGGGGWGDPLERDPSAVLNDVLDEYVSVESARKNYGVVIDEKTFTVLEEETKRLRNRIERERSERRSKEKTTVRYLSPEWQRLCQEAINRDPEFAKLARDLTIKVNNIIENCPDGKDRFLYWRFEGGKLRETFVGPAGELGGRNPAFTTIASYQTFMMINTAKMTVEKAITEGLLRFEGDLVHMMRYAEAFEQFTEVRRRIPTEYFIEEN